MHVHSSSTLTQRWPPSDGIVNVLVFHFFLCGVLNALCQIADAFRCVRNAVMSKFVHFVRIEINAKCPNAAMHRHKEDVPISAMPCKRSIIPHHELRWPCNRGRPQNSQLTCYWQPCDPIIQMPMDRVRRFVGQPIQHLAIPGDCLPVVGHNGKAQHRRRAYRHQQSDQKENHRRRCCARSGICCCASARQTRLRRSRHSGGSFSTVHIRFRRQCGQRMRSMRMTINNQIFSCCQIFVASGIAFAVIRIVFLFIHIEYGFAVLVVVKISVKIRSIRFTSGATNHWPTARGLPITVHNVVGEVPIVCHTMCRHFLCAIECRSPQS